VLLYKKYYFTMIGFFVAAQDVANICYKFFIKTLFFIFHVTIRNKDCVKKSQLDAQLILSIFRQPVHVSGVSRPIIRRYNLCIQQLVLIIIFR